MRVRYVRLGILLLACTATIVMGARYNWTGNSGTDWDDSGNWSSIPGGYPDDCGDDANDLDSNCDLVTEQIDDLAVRATMTFGNITGSPVQLTVDSFIIFGPTTSGTTVVTIGQDAKIVAAGCFIP